MQLKILHNKKMSVSKVLHFFSACGGRVLAFFSVFAERSGWIAMLISWMLVATQFDIYTSMALSELKVESAYVQKLFKLITSSEEVMLAP